MLALTPGGYQAALGLGLSLLFWAVGTVLIALWIKSPRRRR